MSARTAARAHTAGAKLAASAVVLGAASSVAGLGTFGTFTDSTTPEVTRLDSGVVSIALTEAAGVATLSLFDRGVFLAGDTESSPIDLVNDGGTALSELRLGSVATVSSVLDTDLEHGLQLAVESCSEAWAPVDGDWVCGGTTSAHYAGPIVADVVLPETAALAPGSTAHLLLTATLPSTATGELVEGATSSLDFVFSAVQRDGASR
ncbi:hypothetical protein [Geodermatophilus sp. DSM 44513]|uniref:hypothetical protein n=1 Tax=Geodermatophilus sp. DSM 44513 TaxID=1528104 RepID=UPI00126FF2F7|nr:hypothetical protein [Geodermatophilus sp. DSM 44513]WNV76817.1 hypothetical protein RTG05_05950 [Geodermatophilus sp. DSM 44513]